MTRLQVTKMKKKFIFSNYQLLESEQRSLGKQNFQIHEDTIARMKEGYLKIKEYSQVIKCQEIQFFRRRKKNIRILNHLCLKWYHILHYRQLLIKRKIPLKLHKTIIQYWNMERNFPIHFLQKILFNHRHAIINISLWKLDYEESFRQRKNPYQRIISCSIAPDV